MNVSEMIAALSKLDGNLPVYYEYGRFDNYGLPVESVTPIEVTDGPDGSVRPLYGEGERENINGVMIG